MEQLCVNKAGPVCPATVSGDDRRGSKAKRRRKYIFSDQIDHLIREIYLSPPKCEDAPWHPIVGQESRHAALGFEEACP